MFVDFLIKNLRITDIMGQSLRMFFVKRDKYAVFCFLFGCFFIGGLADLCRYVCQFQIGGGTLDGARPADDADFAFRRGVADFGYLDGVRLFQPVFIQSGDEPQTIGIADATPKKSGLYRFGGAGYA